MWVADRKRAVSRRWVGRSAGASHGKSDSEGKEFVHGFFKNNFAYICHFIVCIYRRPYRKLIFVIVDLLILFT